MLKPFKKHILALLYLLGLVTSSPAQTADSRVAEGRVFLEQENLSSAQAKFAAALALDANHANANFFFAATRILSLATTTSGTTFLNRIGVESNGRNIYQWSAGPGEDVNGDLLVPGGVNANEFTGHLRTQILPELTGAAANLAKITNPSFQLNLTAAETTSSAVTVDYGDVLMLRALLHALEYWAYTVNSWNVDTQLTALKALGDAHDLTAQRLLKDYPQLFTFATTADRDLARAAFEGLVARYQSASTAIRSRPLQDGFLFQYDSESADQENDFRQTLLDLEDSLAAPTALTVRPGLTYHLERHFSGTTPLRGLLPQFQGNGVVVGTLPDLTFDGLVTGASAGSIYKRIGDFITVVPRIRSITPEPDDYYALEVDFVDNRPGELTETEDFLDWYYSPVSVRSFSKAAVTLVADGWDNGPIPHLFFRAGAMKSHVFYLARVVDAAGNPVSEAAVSLDNSFEHWSFTDTGGYVGVNALNRKQKFPDSLFRVYVDKPPYPIHATSYKLSATQVEPQTIILPFVVDSATRPANDDFADAITITGFPAMVSGVSYNATAETDEPDHTDLSDGAADHSVWWKWTAPSTGTVTISTTGSDFDTLLGIYTGNSVGALTIIGQHDGEPEDDYFFSFFTFEAQAGTTYYIAVDGYSGGTGDIQLNIISP